jgi:hypothetical protein
MTLPNGLVCFTNCLLPQEDGSLVKKDLWVDETSGLILDAQVEWQCPALTMFSYHLALENLLSA